VTGYLYRFGAWFMHFFMVQVEVWYMLAQFIGTVYWYRLLQVYYRLMGTCLQ
jgi:hypothetical protein